MGSLADTIAPEGNLEERLRELNIVRPSETLVGFNDRFDWTRGGNETFIAAADARVSSKTGTSNRPFIAKAVVGFGTTQQKIENMLANRGLLESAGAPVSELYKHEDSTFYERFLPEQVDAIAYAKREDPRTKDLTAYAAAIDELGYNPIRRRGADLFKELLADGTGAYAFDFGEDLGQPGASNDAHAGLDALNYVIERADLSKERADALMDDYWSRRS